MPEIVTVFKVIGYNFKQGDSFLESCVFWMFAETADEAIAKCKKCGIEKKEYQVTEVTEEFKKGS